MAHCATKTRALRESSATSNGNRGLGFVCLTVSAQISHDHMATAFHFLISKRGAVSAFFAPFACVPYHEKKTKSHEEDVHFAFVDKLKRISFPFCIGYLLVSNVCQTFSPQPQTTRQITYQGSRHPHIFFGRRLLRSHPLCTIMRKRTDRGHERDVHFPFFRDDSKEDLPLLRLEQENGRHQSACEQFKTNFVFSLSDI